MIVNTVDRWLERAAACCRKFDDQRITKLDTSELQADELRTIAGGKADAVWVFATIAMSSKMQTKK